MPRKLLVLTPDYPYHITNRSNNREFFYIDKQSLWRIFLERFEQLKIQFQCEIHQFVLMSNHYHLVLTTPNSNVGEAMKYLHREVARHANKKSHRTNHFFGGRYKWTLIENDLYYWNSVKYVFRNPVKAGICNSVLEYEFSSIHHDRGDFEWRMVDPFLDSKPEIELEIPWLEEPFLNDQERAIQNGLRRRTFSLPTSSKRKRVVLDAGQYKKGTVTC